MKKFLFNLFVYALLISLTAFGINTLYIYRTKSPWPVVPEGIQICNFGSSHGETAFNYEDVKGRYICYNFGIGSQTLLYDYKILETYKDRLQRGAKVFIVASHFSFYGLPDIMDRHFASKNKRYYNFIRKDLIEQYDRRTDLYVSYFPALAADDLVSLLDTLFGVRKPAQDRFITPEEAVTHGEVRYERHILEKKDINGLRRLNPESLDSLYKMIEICHEIGAEPILMTTPLLSEYYDAVMRHEPEFFDDFYGIIGQIIDDTGIRYYDYSRDERYSKNYSYFSDTDHLNKRGARIFTNNLLSEVLGIQ